jgi:hypothetical protein
MAGDPCFKVYREKPAPKRRKAKKPRGRARPDEPMRWRCEICSSNPATERHHKLRRSQGGTDDESNTLDICGPCHADVHANPEFSYREGYLIRRRN